MRYSVDLDVVFAIVRRYQGLPSGDLVSSQFLNVLLEVGFEQCAQGQSTDN